MTSRISKMMRLEKMWADLASRSDTPAYLRVDAEHPFDLYVGLEIDHSRSLVLLTDSEPALKARNLQSLEVVCHRRTDNRWSSVVRLVEPTLSRVFAVFCQDIVESTRSCTTPQQASQFFAERISRWERLFAKRHSGVLDDRTLRGLVGELRFLADYAIPKLGSLAACMSWYGPLEADQDFHFADRLVEVKTAGLSSMRVKISSAEQLDVQGPLFMSVVTLEEAPVSISGVLAVAELVRQVSELMASSPEAESLFQERLGLTGYIPRPEYEERGFRIHKWDHYVVTERFPAVRRACLHHAVGDVTYEVDLAACGEFRVSDCLE